MEPFDILESCLIYNYKYKPMNQTILGLIGFFLILVLPIVTFFVFDYRGIVLYFVFGLCYVLFFLKRQRIDRVRQLIIYFRDEHQQYYRISFVTSIVVSLISGDVSHIDLEHAHDKAFLHALIDGYKQGEEHPDISVHLLHDFAMEQSKSSNIIFTYFENEEIKKIKLSKRYFVDE